MYVKHTHFSIPWSTRSRGKYQLSKTRLSAVEPCPKLLTSANSDGTDCPEERGTKNSSRSKVMKKSWLVRCLFCPL